ncbi:DUF2846 domain-containing protein [Neisseria montereyensis]|uniref:DUF2846 domain-containing protein n=1 Tax=Neisseria montereyensis TaxID=2973938 RepID=A0ABT2FB92_9NEIS|nr:DUF2846 domain-containing protein [Neisseria montereyensis]MCS4533387.1 DUF2846 domain-containing protein [Neisseria montereyensis]
MTLKSLYSLSLLSLFITACNATGTPFTSMEQPVEGQSKIYVYRTKSIKGSTVHFNVNANEIHIGHLRNGGYISADLAPGKYEIWAQTEGMDIPLKPNEIQCVKASVGFGLLAGRPKFQQVPLEQCQAEITNTVHSI